MFLNRAPFKLKGRKTLLLAGDDFSALGSKTAVCFVRYRADDVVAVVGGANAGVTVSDVLGFGGDIPIVADVGEALAYAPEVAVVGVAPRGGQLGEPLRREVLDCAGAGLDIASGLHTFLKDDEEIAASARVSGSNIWDVRFVADVKQVGTGRGCGTGARVVLVTGTDCNVGKMTATVELVEEARRRGLRAAWAATGQTGIMLRERGVCVDRVVADFVSGAAEELVNIEGADNDIVFVEGQGALVHPGYAAVTLGLLFGTMPDCMILAHEPARGNIRRYDFKLPPLNGHIRLHEMLMAPFKRSPVVSIVLNTSGEAADAAARALIDEVRLEAGLPATDVVRFGAGEIIDAVTEAIA